MKATDIRLSYTEDNKPQITLTLDLPRREAQEAVSKAKEVLAKGKPLEVTIRPYRRRRSLDSNSLLWTYCQKIAEVIRSSKEEVYKEFIKRVGQFEIVPIRNDAVETWIENWTSRGLGWHAEVMDDSKLDGYKKVITYYGSSVYDAKAMSILLDEVITEAKELGIEVISDEDRSLLLAEWGQ